MLVALTRILLLTSTNQGRKFLADKSPAYMTARAARLQLENLTKDIQRTTLPRLPPALGFDGDEEYAKQVEQWKKWIEWEKDDPLVLKEDDPAAYKARIIYVYKQSLMSLRFWPEMCTTQQNLVSKMTWSLKATPF